MAPTCELCNGRTLIEEHGRTRPCPHCTPGFSRPFDEHMDELIDLELNKPTPRRRVKKAKATDR